MYTKNQCRESERFRTSPVVLRSISTSPTVRAANTASLCSSTCSTTCKHAAALSNTRTCRHSKRADRGLHGSRIDKMMHKPRTRHATFSVQVALAQTALPPGKNWNALAPRNGGCNGDSEPEILDTKNGRQSWIQTYQYSCGRQGAACREFPACRQLTYSRYAMPVLVFLTKTQKCKFLLSPGTRIHYSTR